ncbi:hypothetical protein ACS0TY_011295 [Phlomoides rotata]
MLYVIGCILLTNKTGNSIGTHYLLLLDDLDHACGVAWDTGALAFLYRQLGLTTRYKVKQFGGFIPLLEITQHYINTLFIKKLMFLIFYNIMFISLAGMDIRAFFML